MWTVGAVSWSFTGMVHFTVIYFFCTISCMFIETIH